MAGPAKPIFREKSLERLSTPDRLDQLLRVVRRRAWIPLLALGGLLVLALVWCFVGRVPVTADALAVLIHPKQVVGLQSPAGGQLVRLDIQVGDTVARGQRIATIHRPDLVKEIALQKGRLEEFFWRADTLATFNKEQLLRQTELIQKQSRRLEQRVKAILERAEKLRVQNEEYIEEQQHTLEEARESYRELMASRTERYESYQELREGLHTSEDELVSARQRLVSSQVDLADVKLKLQEVALRRILADETYERQMDLVAELQLQSDRLAVELAAAEKALKEASIEDESTEAEIRRTIERLESELENESAIIAEDDGVVLEVTVTQGSVVEAGRRIASIAKSDVDQPLRALAYFAIADGKEIEATMPARVSPATVQPQQDGSIVGRVLEASTYPVTAEAVVSQLGNREMAQMLVGDESRIEVWIELEEDPATYSGFRWTSAGGPEKRVTPGTTARVRVTLRERAPITLLIPALRGWLGLE